MLAILSDLHLGDGTAGGRALEPAAAWGMMQRLADAARRARSREVTLLLLGDIVDLTRTTRWITDDRGRSVPLAERPWGGAPGAAPTAGQAARAEAVLGGVLAAQAETLAILAGRQMRRTVCGRRETLDFGDAVVRRVLVPGNHDRLLHLHPALRTRLRGALALDGHGDDAFDGWYLDAEHGLYARHGHEWDVYNAEAPGAVPLQPGPERHRGVPIGDVLAAELAAWLPERAVELAGGEAGEALRERLQELFDVQPLAAIVPWLFAQAQRQDPAAQRAIDQAIREAAGRVLALPYWREWRRRHDRMAQPLNAAERLAALLELVHRCGLARHEGLLRMAQGTRRLWPSDNYAACAARDFRALDAAGLGEGIVHVAYGHTHRAEQRPLGSVGSNGRRRDRFYLNTGTWRPVHQQHRARRGFATWWQLSYTLIFAPGERVPDRPVFEAWTGALQETPVNSSRRRKVGIAGAKEA